MIEYYLDAVSTYAQDIDRLIWLILILVGFWTILVMGIFFWLILRFRASRSPKAAYYSGGEKEMRWILAAPGLVLICDIFIIVADYPVWHNVKQNLPPAERTIRVISQQWAWTFVHPGADGQLDTADDITTVDDLYIEKDVTYHYKLESRDVLHSFSVPVFRLKQDAIPGREITGWFEAIKTGNYSIQCTEICGIGHGIMGARITIETPEKHKEWIARMSQ
ncbi:MAG: cytochrome C oxidase subunit II [Planctomycetota bacterium]|jgi:cytochrome c oxidase subunit 2|nr:cytochrome C oxidase subunit II [Planctomycetota bacterium]